MNILLVDDDNLILQELKYSLKKEELELEKIFVASCIEEAKKILSTVPVQIMLCDIEMPGGSGLELLEWVRGRGFLLECIFLTNYADFSYARQAISLESMEYLLKPVEARTVCDAVKRAGERVKKSRQDAQARQYWLDNGKEAKDIFWKQYLLSEVAYREDSLKRLGYGSSDQFIEVGIKAVSLTGAKELWGTDMFEYVLKNVLFELLKTSYFEGESVFCTKEGIWIAVCRFSPDVAPDGSAVEVAMEQIVLACEEMLHIEAAAGVGYVCQVTGLKKQLSELVGMMENLLEKKDGILCVKDYQPMEYSYEMPDISIWESLLKENEKDGLMKDIRRHVEMRARDGWTKQQMQAFRQDITQMFYSNLRESGILAHKLITGKEAETLYLNSLNSVEDMCRYCDSLSEQVIAYKKYMEEPSTVMDTILRYVDEHYCEEINRSDLADLVYISNDYCSRIFKRETGRSLAQYVLEKRVEMAKKLLESDLSVKNVALSTGYSNFSYFSKVFKDTVGMTPMEYREKYGRPTG